MPNRIIKESVCTSETIDQMTWFEECFFTRLWTACDDYGRMDARPAILKSKLFPLKERLPLKDVQNALQKMVDIGCVKLYECDSKPYLYLPSWEVHQKQRAKRSKYPAPENSVIADDIICNHMQADVPVIQSNPNPIRESETESETESNARDAVFDAFWDAYPRKVGKEAARKAFAKVPKEVYPQLLPALAQQKQSAQWQKDNGQYIPHPATWLNQGRWDDEPLTPQSCNVFLSLLKEESL